VEKTYTSIVLSTTHAVGALALLFASACGGAPATVTALPRSPARAVAGVVFDLEPSLPQARERSRERGVVALYRSRHERAIDELLSTYIRAMDRADDADLSRVLAKDASMLARSATARRPLFDAWRERMRASGPTRAALRLTLLEARSFEELKPAGVPPRPPEMRAGDLFVQVRITRRSDLVDDVREEVLAFLLRREEGQLRFLAELEPRLD
jgi:hypothetical protein